MDGLSGLGAGSVPIYHKPRSASKNQNKSQLPSAKQRSRSKKRILPIPTASASSSEDIFAPRTTATDDRPDIREPVPYRGAQPQVKKQSTTLGSDLRQSETDLKLSPSPTASTISLPLPPPALIPSRHGSDGSRQSNADSTWSDARRGRPPRNSKSQKRGRERNEALASAVVEQEQRSQNAAAEALLVDFARAANRILSSIGETVRPATGNSDRFHHQQPSDNNSSHLPIPTAAAPPPPPPPLPAAGTAPRPDPPAAARHEDTLTALYAPTKPLRIVSKSAPPSWPYRLSLSPPEHKPPRPPRPRIVPPGSYQPHSFSHSIPQPTRSPPPVLRRPTMAPSNSSGTYTATANVNSTALNPTSTFQHIQDMAAKRVSTLDYLRKTHEGRVYWFNTLLYARPDILRLPSFQPARLARRASSLLLLGLSLPLALDAVSSSSPLDYLRALNALLSEFEAYQTVHPLDGSTTSSGSFSRAKIPQMFKRSHGVSAGLGKSRRASTAADIGLPLGPDFGSLDGASGVDSMASSTGTLAGSQTPASASGTTLVSAGAGNAPQLPNAPQPANTTSLPPPDLSFLLPGEEYAYLLTPSLPFDPDFFEVFATLCDVLIDVYVRIAGLVNSPEKVALQPGLADVFAKADARVRKVLVQGVVKEFEDATRGGVKGEVAGVGKVVLGGLM